MKFTRSRKAASIDFDYIIVLHTECIEQLDLMNANMEAAQFSNYSMRDILDDTACKHWFIYTEIIHTICMHDENMEKEIKTIGLDTIEKEPVNEQQGQSKRILLLSLVKLLIRLHQRYIAICGKVDEANKSYLVESEYIERKSLVKTIEMVHTIL